MKKLAFPLVGFALLVSGCASTGMTDAQFKQLQADIAAAKAAAQAAQTAAQQANMTAKDAKAIAVQTDEKLNRMFKKSQMK